MGCGICSKVKENKSDSGSIRRKEKGDSPGKKQKRSRRKSTSSNRSSEIFKEDSLMKLKARANASEISSDGEECSETDAPKRVRPRSTSRTPKNKKKKSGNTKSEPKISGSEVENFSMDDMKENELKGKGKEEKSENQEEMEAIKKKYPGFEVISRVGSGSLGNVFKVKNLQTGEIMNVYD